MQEAPVIEKEGRKTTFSVLIADDVHGDRFILKRAIRSSAPTLAVVGEVEDGKEIISYLSGEDKYADRKRHPFPDLLFLDLRMPLMDGFEVLTWLRKRAIAGLKVIVLAGSLEPNDRQRVLDLGFECAYLKPWRREGLADILRMVEADLSGVGQR
jgi:CheY-like chemotaxis protein